MRSEEIGVWVGVRQGSVFSPLLFILVLEAFSHEFRIGVQRELLYADDLVLFKDTQQERISRLKVWKAGMKSKWLRVNLTKILALMSWRNSASTPVLSAVVVSPATPLSAHNASCGSTRDAAASLEDWWPTQYMFAAVVMVRLGQSIAEPWLKWMSTAPCLMWRPPSATWVTCCALVGAVTVPKPSDVAWPGESSRNHYLS